MRWLLIATLAGLQAAFCSCAVLSIHRNNEVVRGLPFYVKTGVCRHEATWLEPVYTLTLQSVTMQAGKETLTPLGVVEFSLSEYKASQEKIATLRLDVLDGKDPESTWASLQKDHAYNPLAEPRPKKDDIVLISNVNKLETTIDYRNLYYYNVKKPFVGTAKADVKLNADGTLSEGSSELESKTLQSFLDLLPVTALISKAAGVKEREMGYRLEVKSRAIKHTLYRYEPVRPLKGDNSAESGPQCSVVPAPDIEDPSFNRELEVVSAGNKSGLDDNKSVKVSGKIALPPKQD